MNLYDQTFSESKKDKKLLLIKKYSGEASFCGYVLSYNSNAVQIQHFSRNGKSDGIITIRYFDIYYITINDEYLDSLQYLIDNNDLIDKEKNGVLPLEPTSEWIYQTLWEYKKDKSTLLGVEINGDWYIGFVDNIDDTFLSFIEIERNGIELDTSIFKIEDITSIHINELDSRRRLLLYNWRKSRKK